MIGFPDFWSNNSDSQKDEVGSLSATANDIIEHVNVGQ